MTRKQELSNLRKMEFEIQERLGADPYAQYCDFEEDLDDVIPQMEMAADEARLAVLSARIRYLEVKNKKGSK